MELQGRKGCKPDPEQIQDDESVHQLSQKALERLKKSSATREQNEKTESYLHDTLMGVFKKLHQALTPSSLLDTLGSVASRFSGKIDNKIFAKHINCLSTVLKEKLSASAEVEGIFSKKSNPQAISKLLDILSKNPKHLKNLKADPCLIANALTELGRRYFNFYAQDKIIKRKVSGMEDALAKLQDAFNWITANKENTQMGWTELLISTPVLFKLMKTEKQTIYYKGADSLEKEFLTLVLNKLIENPSCEQREKMLLPIMNQFAKADGDIRQKLVNSLKTIEF